MSEAQDPQEVDRIDPRALAAFEGEMRRRDVDLGLYHLHFWAASDEYTVETQFKDKPPGLRGSVPGFPDYEVVISRKDFTVVRVSIAR